MTRYEVRKMCIEAMKDAYTAPQPSFSPSITLDNIFTWRMTAAFDSLHGIARVNGMDCTVEMIELGSKYENTNAPIGLTFRAMARAGDLTNQPEKKP